MPDLALDLRYLRYAIVVAEHGSFRRAAEILNLSQSTVSRRIQLLERRLGVPLFERARSGTRLTNAGEHFVRDAGVAAKRLCQAIHDTQTAHKGEIGELRIGITSSLASGFLPELLKDYRRAFPKVGLGVEEAAAQVIGTDVLSGRLDVAFIADANPLPGCDCIELWSEDVLIAVARDHRLAGAVEISWEDIREETFLVSADATGHATESYLIRRLSTCGEHPRTSAHRVDRANLVNMAALGFGIVPTLSSSKIGERPDVEYLRIGSSAGAIAFSAMWLKGNRNPILSRFLDAGVARARGLNGPRAEAAIRGNGASTHRPA